MGPNCRDDEHFVYSFCSTFGNKSALKDVPLTKYQIAIIPKRFMLEHAAPRWLIFTTWTQSYLPPFFELGRPWPKHLMPLLKRSPQLSHTRKHSTINNMLNSESKWGLTTLICLRTTGTLMIWQVSSRFCTDCELKIPPPVLHLAEQHGVQILPFDLGSQSSQWNVTLSYDHH